MALPPSPPRGIVVGRVAHCSAEATVARDAAGAVGGGHPARQAERCLGHSRYSYALRARPPVAEQATPYTAGDERAARARVGGHAMHRSVVDESGKGAYEDLFSHTVSRMSLDETRQPSTAAPHVHRVLPPWLSTWLSNRPSTAHEDLHDPIFTRGMVVSRVGFEPTTQGLKVPCSAAELPARAQCRSRADVSGR